jgi:CheY-like chemotaxis protein
LGLTITQHFCRMMGVEISVESEPGQGTTFIIRLPLCVTADERQMPQSEQRSGHLPGSPPPVSGPIVLVIDDDPNVRNLLDHFLGKEGFCVKTAASSEEGLRLARELHPAVITLDVLMPIVDGWTVLTTLKANPATAAIPVIVLTITDDKNLGFALGASDYLTKPIDHARLAAVLKKNIYKDMPRSVLIVEDDPVTREMMRRMLEKEGWGVTEAENGRVGLERLAESTPGTILLDLMMPEMDGFEFIAQVRKHQAWGAIPVIVVTAKDLTEEDRLRLNGYVNKILQKGAYSREELLNEVRDLVAAYVRSHLPGKE